MKLPEKYSHTLVYLTRVRSRSEGNDKNQFVFSNQDEDEARPLNASEVFEVLRPEVRMHAGGELRVANRRYRALKLKPPKAQPEGESLPIQPDSILLELAKGKQLDPKRIGGEIVRALLLDLDVVSRYSGPKFTRGLLDFAHHYLASHVDSDAGDRTRAGSVQIERLVKQNATISDEILRVLQSPGADIARAKEGLERALDETDISAASDGDGDAIRKRFVRSLMHLRERVLLEDRRDDPTLQRIIGESPHDENTRAAMAWIGDFSRYEGGFRLGNVKSTPPGGSLAALYQHFMHHTENVSRFARMPVLHAYVFLWLMSKYESYGEDATYSKPAGSAYRRSVLGAPNRTEGESDADRMRHRKTTATAGERVIKKFEEQNEEAEGRHGEEMLKLKAEMARELLDSATRIYEPQNVLYRAELQRILEDLFLETARAVGGGEAEKLMEECRTFIARYRQIYQKLLKVVRTLENLKDADTLAEAVKKTGSGPYRDAVACVATQARKVFVEHEAKRPQKLDEKDEHTKAYVREIRRALTTVFANEVGDVSMQLFSTEFDKNAKGIEAEMTRLRSAYRTDRRIGRATEKVRDCAATAATPSAMASDAELNRKARANVAREMATQRPPMEQTFDNAETVREALTAERPTVNADLIAGKEVIGKVEINEKGTHVVLDAPKFVSVDLNDDIVLDTKGIDEIGMDEVDPDSDIRGFIDDAAQAGSQDEDEIAHELGQLPDYGEKCEQIRERYCSTGTGTMEDEAIPRFSRARRAQKLGEFVQSARDEETQLGVPDLSQGIRLAIDVVHKLGDLDNDELFAPEPDARTSEKLGSEDPDEGPRSEIDLSKMFPADEEDEGKCIQEMMNYYMSMCRSVDDVRDHLADLSDLAAIADTLDPDARLVVVNQSLEEHLASCKAPNEFLQQHHHPGIMLIGRTAGGGTPERWAEFEKHLGLQLENKREKQKNGEKSADLSCPVIIAHDKVDEACPFPVATMGDIETLGLVEAPHGREKGEEPNSKPEALLVEYKELLPSMIAAMAITPMSDTNALGQFPSEPIHGSVSEKVESVSGVGSFLRDDNGEPVVAFLRRCWRESRTNTALEATVMARVATIAMQRPADDLTQYGSFHKAYIENADKDGHPALEGMERLLGAERPQLEFKLVNGGGKLQDGGSSEKLFGNGPNGGNPVRMEMPSARKTTRREDGNPWVTIPNAMRAKLACVKV